MIMPPTGECLVRCYFEFCPIHVGLGDTDFLIHTIIVQQNIAIYDNIVIFEITIIITPEYARSTLFSY